MAEPLDPALLPEVALPALALQSLLDATGVREFVICAGARNSALLVMLAAVPGLRLWHHFEERSAAFFALGRILDHERPVAVVTTSGTAVAELLPAVIEAHYQGLPLIALTADRPVSYRGTGAPQAIEQAGIFSCYPKLALDVTGLENASAELAKLTTWDFLGPLHLNLCLEEPTAASLPFLREAGAALRFAATMEEGTRWFKEIPLPDPAEFPNPLVLIGDLLPWETRCVEWFAAELEAPVYAEASSGLRDSAPLADLILHGGDHILKRQPHGSVIRLGGVPSCRFWRDLENRPEIPVLSYTRSGHSGLARPSIVRPLEDCLTKPEFTNRGTCTLHHRPDDRLTKLLATLPGSEPALVHALSQIIPEESVMFTGNSLAVREWNLCARQECGIHARALRGANGIDGNLSAFLGLAADAEDAWCLVGDLTTLYDLAAPWMLPQLKTPRLRIVVMQNGGGKIFSQLPSLQGLTDFERQLMENPHRISLAGWAEQWGLHHVSCEGRVPDPASLPDRVVIELHPDATATQSFWKAWAEESAFHTPRTVPTF
ncbi:MAG: 2-succinyl-5-enolpyruvyl-6-hydroxy-3-cyclohexene-1-carboxylic-acid synthase [Verrucomicrobiota bacterium]